MEAIGEEAHERTYAGAEEAEAAFMNEEEDAALLAQQEEDRKSKLAAALQALEAIPVGQAFATMRVMKKAGETLRPSPRPDHATMPTRSPSMGHSPAAGSTDLSLMLPGSAFGVALPNGGFGSTVGFPPTPSFGAGVPAVMPPTAPEDDRAFASSAKAGAATAPLPSADSDPAAAAPPSRENPDPEISLSDGGVFSAVAAAALGPLPAAIGALNGVASVPASGSGAEPPPTPELSAEQVQQAADEKEYLDASLEAKLMATWHYAEATEDGGIAISFGNLEGLDMENACEELYATMLKHVEEENKEADNAEQAFMQQMADEGGATGGDAPGGDGGEALMSMMDALPSPAFALPAPAFGMPLPAAADSGAEVRPTESARTYPAPSFTAPGLPLPAVASGKQLELPSQLEDEAQTSPPASAPGGERLSASPSMAPIRVTDGVPAVSAPTSPAYQSLIPPAVAAAAVTNLNATNPKPGSQALSKEAITTMKADLARTIRSELQKTMLPMRMGTTLNNASSAKTTPRGHAVGPGAAAAVALAAAGPSGAAAPGPSSKPTSTSAAGSVGSPGRMPHTSDPASSSAYQSEMERSIRVGFVEGKIRPINIVMLIVGTRGDVQPFIGIGLKLKEYGHRVRIASHKVYREFVTGFGLEFYPIGGDPKVLSEFVVKHRGIMPGLDIADALQQREQVKQILYSSWGACVKPDPENPHKPFIADAIVANPPAYGHTHCAEKLNVPLHIVFTMPWTPTKQFPNPFARIKTVIGGTNSKAREVMNWLSYFAVEDLAWLGMSGMVKDFRKNTLQLTNWESKDNGSHAIYHSKVPMTYIWSPSLVDRPIDWPGYCEVVGFINVELQKLTKYQPPKEIQDFLDAGPPPVYIGFGSLVVDDPEKLTRCFLDSIKATGLRAIIQKGWGGLGAGVKGNVDDVLFIGPAPHDWLFTKCCAVVHHGGAGTTACGLYCGKPTFIVPFFGDQPFWGAACHKAGVGPAPVSIDDLNLQRCTDALKTLVMPNCQRAAKLMQDRMMKENGIEGTVDHLHRTIYGALLAGKTFKWMKNGASRAQLAAMVEEEEVDPANPEGGIKGFFQSFFVTKSQVAKPTARTKSNTNMSALGLANDQAMARPSATGFSFHVAAANREIPTPSPGSALGSQNGRTAFAPARASSGGSRPAVVAAVRQAPIVEDARRKGGFFSFLGC